MVIPSRYVPGGRGASGSGISSQRRDARASAVVAMRPISSLSVVAMANAQDAAPRCTHGPTVSGRRATLAHASPRLALCAWALAVTGCGHAVFAMEVRSASMRVAEAREVGAQELAPYEYYYAEAHLEKAKQEAAEADFGDAIDLASTSEEYAQKAIELSQSARQGADQ